MSALRRPAVLVATIALAVSIGPGSAMAADTTPPTMTSTAFIPRLGASPGKTTVPVKIAWKGTDDVGIVTYDVQWQVDDGPWAPLVTNTTATSLARTLTVGKRYAFRVRGTDAADLTSAWLASPVTQAKTYQQTSSKVTYAGTWAKGAAKTYWGGTTAKTSTKGRSATFTFTGVGMAWVAPVGPTRGGAKVYLDGVLVSSVSLYAAKTPASKIVFDGYWSATATHTVKIVNSASTGHPRIDIDGFIALVEP